MTKTDVCIARMVLFGTPRLESATSVQNSGTLFTTNAKIAKTFTVPSHTGTQSLSRAFTVLSIMN